MPEATENSKKASFRPCNFFANLVRRNTLIKVGYNYHNVNSLGWFVVSSPIISCHVCARFNLLETKRDRMPSLLLRKKYMVLKLIYDKNLRLSHFINFKSPNVLFLQ